MVEIGLARRAVRSPWAAVDPGRVAVLATGVFWLVLVSVALPQELVQDSWLTLASGREIVAHGLPQADALTIWTSGRQWVDQQWLGQLSYYALAQLGGVRLVLLVHAATLVGAVGIALSTARRLGASATSVLVVGVAGGGGAARGPRMGRHDPGERFFGAPPAPRARHR